MFGIDDALIAAVAAPVIGGLFSAKGAKDANQMSQGSADKEMEFQERMSNTAHQREVADLRAAGLNPLLSLNSGASTPSGAMGSFQNPYAAFGSMGTDVYSGYNSARMTRSNIERNEGEIHVPGFGRTTIANAKRMWNNMSSKAKKVFKEKYPDVVLKIKSAARVPNSALDASRMGLRSPMFV